MRNSPRDHAGFPPIGDSFRCDGSPDSLRRPPSLPHGSRDLEADSAVRGSGDVKAAFADLAKPGILGSSIIRGAHGRKEGAVALAHGSIASDRQASPGAPAGRVLDNPVSHLAGALVAD